MTLTVLKHLDNRWLQTLALVLLSVQQVVSEGRFLLFHSVVKRQCFDRAH